MWWLRSRILDVASFWIVAAFFAVWASPVLAQTEEAQTLGQRANELFAAGKYDEALAASEQADQITERHDTANGEPGFETAQALGRTAWHALFARRPEKALAASDRALSIAPGLLWLRTNRLHALVFLGRVEEARAGYVGHKGEIILEIGKWEDAVAADFLAFEQRGLKHPEFPQIQKALAEAPESSGNPAASLHRPAGRGQIRRSGGSGRTLRRRALCRSLQGQPRRRPCCVCRNAGRRCPEVSRRRSPRRRRALVQKRACDWREDDGAEPHRHYVRSCWPRRRAP